MRFVLDVEREWVGEDGQGSIQSSPPRLPRTDPKIWTTGADEAGVARMFRELSWPADS